jgi:hypothetical protein
MANRTESDEQNGLLTQEVASAAYFVLPPDSIGQLRAKSWVKLPGLREQPTKRVLCARFRKYGGTVGQNYLAFAERGT